MEKYLSIIILIAPGFIIRKITELLVSKKQNYSDFEKTIISLLYGIPVIVINIILINFSYKIESITVLINNLNNINFIFYYLGISSVSITICTILTVVLSKKTWIKIINCFRRLFKSPELGENNTPWEEFFEDLGNPNYNMPVEIIKDDKVISKGFIKNWDLDGLNDKDIVLEYCDEYEKAKDFIKEVKRVYYNPKCGIIIKEYVFDQEGYLKHTEASQSKT